MEGHRGPVAALLMVRDAALATKNAKYLPFQQCQAAGGFLFLLFFHPAFFYSSLTILLML
jgi:hypothetical protein